MFSNQCSEKVTGVWDLAHEKRQMRVPVWWSELSSVFCIWFLSDGCRDNGTRTGYCGDSSDPELGVAGFGLRVNPIAFYSATRRRWGDREPAEWWMESTLAFSFPFPDLPPLIAFPELSFAGNGLKRDTSHTRCLPKERESTPPSKWE